MQNRDYHLAIDIGASSGRHMLFSLDPETGKIEYEEIYRFENAMTRQGRHLLWDVDRLFSEIKTGMRRCAETGRIPKTMAIDTWAVDYVLLDEKDQRLGDAFGYRDHRTDGMDEEVKRVISEEDLYRRTGIQKQIFNTIYQLTADRIQRPGLLEKAKVFLMLPDYFAFLLTGKKASEYTNATSTQLLDHKKKQWDIDLIKMLGLPEGIFLPLSEPGNSLGHLKEDIQKEVGFDLEVLQCATHDTASAVMAMPYAGGTEEGAVYISSGTWSLMGTELPEALCDEESRHDNFTNEGGYEYRFRYLKNIMGLWMIQSVRHETGDSYSFPELASLAEKKDGFKSLVDVNDDSFLAPENMTRAIRDYCERTGQRAPHDIGELSSVIYRSLAKCYGDTVSEIEKNTKQKYDSIYIIGGGCNNDYLNRLTARTTGKTVYSGPSEATAIGNALSQMIAKREIKDLQEARRMIKSSFLIRTYYPD